MIENRLWFTTVLSRLLVFLFVFINISFFIFLLGNYQEFLDVTQIKLLKFIETISLLFLISSVYYLVILVVNGFYSKKFQKMRIIVSLVAIGGITLNLFVVKFILTWTVK